MFERQPFQGLPGGALAAELAATDPAALDDDRLADYLRAARRLEAWAGSLLVRGVGEFAERHRAERHRAEPPPDGGTDDADGAGQTSWPGRARPVRFGGEGTPLVDEFAADALAPVLRVAPMTAGTLIGDALDLRHRLPWTRTGLRDGTVTFQAARAIASGTRDLSPAALDRADVDRRLYRSATRLTPGRLRPRIAEVVAGADPDRLDDEAGKQPRRLHVGFSPQPQQQTTSIFGELDPVGAQHLDARISGVARLLRRLDGDSPWEALRARALALLADPEALEGLRARVRDNPGGGRPSGDGPPGDGPPGDGPPGDGPPGDGPPGDGPPGDGPPGDGPLGDGPSGDGPPGAGPGAGPVPTTGRLSTTVVHVHADAETWRTGDGPVELEGFGWLPLRSLRGSLAAGQLRVVPVPGGVDAGEHPASGPIRSADPPGGEHRHRPDPTYVPRAHTREEVAARDRTCRFPGCNRHARRCQLDHTVPWPHGPTCACNLGALCTRHHRLKTHTGWRLSQPWPGVFLWRSPAGGYHLSDSEGTTDLVPSTTAGHLEPATS